MHRSILGDDPTNVDYERVFYARRPILEIAVKNFLANQAFQADFKNFEKNNRLWLDDFAEFMAIKEHLVIKRCKNGMIKSGST